MRKTIPDNLDISDIEFIKDEKKHILDSSDKIIRWIKYKFNEQRTNSNNDSIKIEFIDLSDCIISTRSHDGKPIMTNLCDIIKEDKNGKLSDCFTNNGNDYHQEIYKMIICNNSIVHSAFFHQTKFYKEVDFEGTEFRGYASFSSCFFEKHANFQKTKYSGNFDFESCTFNDYVWFNGAQFDVYEISFRSSIFKAGLDAEKIKFINGPTIINSKNPPYITFGNARFNNKLNLSNIDFTRNCIFNGAKFESNVEFFNTNFKTVVDFNNSQINGNILFAVNTEKTKHSKIIQKNIVNIISLNHINITGRIDIECCDINKLEGFFANIKEGAIIRIYESFIKTLDFTSISNKGVLILEDNHDGIDKIILTSAINFGIIETENTNIKNINDRRTARIFKDSALKYGNNIDALEFRKEEMRLLKKERQDKNLGFDLLLYLNGISNNHGTEWKKGFIFTFCCWIGFYLLFLITSRVDDIFAFITGKKVTWVFSNDILNGVRYLWSLNFLDTLSVWVSQLDFKTVWWMVLLKSIQLIIVFIIFILGKIAIGYGIYQTITAFRKYGK